MQLLCFRRLSHFLSLFRRGFQDLLNVSPSSPFMVCGCTSSSMDSLTGRSMYPGFAESSLIIWSWLMLCSATVDISVCASLVCLLCSLTLIWRDYRFVQYKPGLVGLLWTRDQAVAETHTWQHTTFTRNSLSLRYSNPQSLQASGRRTTP
jgi:hypothetical protein